MPDLFGLETSQFIPPEVKSDIAPIEFDPVKFNKELDKAVKNWEAQVYRERQNLWDEYKTKREAEGYDVSFIDPHNNTILNTTYDPQMRMKNVYSLARDASMRQRKQLQDWNKWYMKEQRKRFEKLSPEFRSAEIARGGILNQNFALLSFVEGFNRGASLGLLKSKDPIYGDEFLAQYPNAFGYGNLIGTLANFMMLSKVAAAFKIPELLAKAKSLQPILKVLGAPKYYAGKIGRLKFGMDAMTDMARKGIIKVPTKYLTDQAMRYGTMEAAGALGLTNGLVGALSEGVRNTAKRFQHEDTMSTKEWRRSLPRSLAEGFFNRYFIGLINDPASWPARFLGDGIYANGQQLYRIVSGQQESFNSSDFWRSFIEGHILGEVQGVIFKPNRQQLAQMHANNRLMEYARDLQKKWGGNVDDYWREANELWMSELQNVYDKKRFYTPDERKFAVDQYNKQIGNGYTLWRGIKDAPAFEIDSKVIGQISDAAKGRMYDIAKRQFGLTKEEVRVLQERNALDDSEVLLKTLKEFNKFTPGVQKEVQPETISRALQGIRNMGVDDFMDNIELYMKQFYDRDVDILEVFERPGEEVRPVKPELQVKEAETSAAKEEAVNRVMNWLYEKNAIRTLIKNMAGTTITDPENLVAQALEEFWKRPAELFDEAIVQNPIGYFMGILGNVQKQTLKKAKGSVPLKEVGEEIERIAVKEAEAEERSERYSNAIFRIYDTYAKKGKSQLKRFMAFYLRSIGNSLPAVREKMNTLGFKIDSENAVAQLVKNARADIEKVILGREALKQVPVRRAYTEQEIRQIREQIEEEGTKVNRITGARKDLPKSILKNIESRGAYIVSFTSLYKEIIKRYGKDIADKVLWKANQVLQKEVDDINQDLIKRKAGLQIRNPLAENSTKFIITRDGIYADEFRDIMQQINNVLKQNYDDMADADKRFAVTIKRADDTGDVISDFDNISVSFFRDLGKIYGESDKYESLKDISRIINPVANTLLNRSYYNIDNKGFIKAVADVEKLVDLAPRTDEEWVSVLERMNAEDPDKVERLARAVEEVSKQVDIFTSTQLPERTVDQESRKKFFEASKAEEQRLAKNDVSINARSLVDVLVKNDIKDLFFLDIAKGFNNVKGELKTFMGSLNKAILEKFTVLENLERRGEPEQRAMITLYNLANAAQKGDYRASDLLHKVFMEFNSNILAGGGEAGQRAMMAYQKIGQIQREEEFAKIFDKKTGRLKINPKELQKPIKFKKGQEDIKRDLESLKDRPQDFSPEFIVEVLKSVDDPLVYYCFDPLNNLNLFDFD